MPIFEHLVLDTHILVWLLAGDEQLERSDAMQAVTETAGHHGLLVSAISVWEIAMLESRGRIRLACEIHEWVNRGLGGHGLELAPLSPSVAIDSTRLPGEVHGDPADRILIATARHYQCPLVTADQAILNYARDGAVTVLAV